MLLMHHLLHITTGISSSIRFVLQNLPSFTPALANPLLLPYQQCSHTCGVAPWLTWHRAQNAGAIQGRGTNAAQLSGAANTAGTACIPRKTERKWQLIVTNLEVRPIHQVSEIRKNSQ